MSSDRFEQELPSLLDDLYVGPMPTYRDDVIHQTARTRQRPAWTFIERWLPMVEITRQPLVVPRMPWRAIGLGLVLLALLVALVAALVAAGRPNLPQPFGRARAGLVAYATGGDIYTVDPVTGSSTALVTGPDKDLNPRWSRDGTLLAFERQAASDFGAGVLFVTRRDGSAPIRVTPKALPDIGNYTFSPDGKEILISASPTAFTHILIAATDGSGIRQVDLPGPATDAAWRPNGSEILFMDSATDPKGSDSSIYAINPQTGKVRTILAGADAESRFRGHPAWSPDGSRISYGEWCGCTSNGPLDVQTHIIAADGTGDRILPIPTGAVWQAPESWSNDGARLLAIRGYTGGIEQSRPVAVPVAGSGFGIEIPYPGGIGTADVYDWEWAPDDTSILGTPADPSGAMLDQEMLDPVSGTYRTLPWKSTSQPTWQRLAP